MSERYRDVSRAGRTVEEVKVGTTHAAHFDLHCDVSVLQRRKLHVLGPKITRTVETKRTDPHEATIRAG
jgi:hypothetical protein